MYTDPIRLKYALSCQGFSGVKFPGGGGDNRRHVSSVILWDIIDDEVAFIMLPRKDVLKSFTNEDWTIGESPIQTAVREFQEEVMISLDPSSIELCWYSVSPRYSSKCVFVGRMPRVSDESIVPAWQLFSDMIEPSKGTPSEGCPILVTLGTCVSMIEDLTAYDVRMMQVALLKSYEKIRPHLSVEMQDKNDFVLRSLKDHKKELILSIIT